MRNKLKRISVLGVVFTVMVVLLLDLFIIPQPTQLAAFGEPVVGSAGVSEIPGALSDPLAQAPLTSENYIALVSGLYAVDNDLERARDRLRLLGLEDPGPVVSDLADRFRLEGRGDSLVVDLATLGRNLGAERAELLPYVATPTTMPAAPAQSPAEPSLIPGVDWDPRLSFKLEPAVKLIPAEVSSGQTYWRLIRAYWQDPEEGHDMYHIFVNVLNRDGVPIPQPVIVENGGKTTVQAEAKPDSEYLINYGMSGTLGSYTCYVAGDMPSDRIAGLGLGFAKGGKDHTSFLLTFQETVAP